MAITYCSRTTALDLRVVPAGSACLSGAHPRPDFWRIAAGVAVCVAALIGVASPANSASPPFPLGAFIGNPNGSDATAEAHYETTYRSFVSSMKARPHFALVYTDYTQPVSAWPSNAGWAAWSSRVSPDAENLLPIIGLALASTASGSAAPDQQFKAFAAGTYDTEIQGVVQAWVKQGFMSLRFRLGWEMNLQGTPTYAGDTPGNEADWIAAFRHVHDVIKAAALASGATASIYWNPGATNYSNVSATNSLYPGDRYVDIVGVDMYGDMYPYSDSSSPRTYHDWDTGGEDTSIAQFIADPINRAHYWSYPAATKWALDSSQGHSQSFSSLAQFALAHRKPLDVVECGAGNSNAGTDVQDDPTFPQWLAQQLDAFKAAGGRVGIIGVWDSNGGGNYEFSFAADKKPKERAAWMTYFGGGAGN
jgi:hypothetical protein